MLADAFIDAFVVSAEEDDVVEHRQSVRHLLGKKFPVWTHIDHLIVGSFFLQMFNTACNRLYHHHHAGSSAKGIIIHILMLTGGIIADVMKVNCDYAFILGTFQDRLIERTFKHLRK